jgi:hypothetical protein
MAEKSENPSCRMVVVVSPAICAGAAVGCEVNQEVTPESNGVIRVAAAAPGHQRQANLPGAHVGRESREAEGKSAVPNLHLLYDVEVVAAVDRDHLDMVLRKIIVRTGCPCELDLIA